VPLYEYVCQPNGHRFEIRHGMNEEGPTACPECGSPVRRVIHPVGIMFKGSGFYATDSRQSTSTPKGGSESSGKAAKSGETTGESKPATETTGGSTTSSDAAASD
jgi:putative FmdB family regulatory protein